MRFSAPVPHATFRMTTEAVDLDGVEIPAGQQVLVCLAAADRDPTAFADADRLDVLRHRASHLGFGHGIHFCLGAPLARLEARIAFAALLGRFPDLARRASHDLPWTHGDGLVLRGLAGSPSRSARRVSGELGTQLLRRPSSGERGRHDVGLRRRGQPVDGLVAVEVGRERVPLGARGDDVGDTWRRRARPPVARRAPGRRR